MIDTIQQYDCSYDQVKSGPGCFHIRSVKFYHEENHHQRKYFLALKSHLKYLVFDRCMCRVMSVLVVLEDIILELTVIHIFYVWKIYSYKLLSV